MARTIRVLRAFAAKSRDGKEQRYFAPDNQHELEEFISPEELEYRQEQGFISVDEQEEHTEPRGFERPTDELSLQQGNVSMFTGTLPAARPQGSTTSEPTAARERAAARSTDRAVRRGSTSQPGE